MNTSQSKDQSLGQELLAKRKALGWSMEEAAHVTKLRMDVIAKIEEDRFDLLPNHAYARGFVRIYARELGLDVFVILKKLDGIVGEEVEWAELRPESLEVLPPKSNLQRIRARHIGLVVILGVIVVVLGILGLGFYRIGFSQIIPERFLKWPKAPEVVTPAKVETVKQAEPAPVTPPKEDDKKKEEVISKAEPVIIPKAEPVIPKAEPVIPKAIPLNHLRLHAADDCYVQVKATKGGKEQVMFQGMISGGRTEPDLDKDAWSGESFHIFIRDVEQVTIIYNDKESKRDGDGQADFILPSN